MENLGMLVMWIAFALICYAIAKEKGKNIYVAIALGLMFGLFAVIGYLLARGSNEYQWKKLQNKMRK